MTDTLETPTPPTALFLALGMAAKRGGGFVFQIEELDCTGKRAGKFATFEAKAKHPAGELTAGYVYRIPVEVGEGVSRTFWFGKAERQGPWDDDGERQAIRAAHDTARAAQTHLKRVEKGVKDDASLSRLKPLAYAYAKLATGTERDLFELRVLRAIRGFGA